MRVTSADVPKTTVLANVPFGACFVLNKDDDDSKVAMLTDHNLASGKPLVAVVISTGRTVDLSREHEVYVVDVVASVSRTWALE